MYLKKQTRRISLMLHMFSFFERFLKQFEFYDKVFSVVFSFKCVGRLTMI